jgi:hypothetical protein
MAIRVVVRVNGAAPALLSWSAMQRLSTLHGSLIVIALAACGSSSSTTPDASTTSAASAACESVGVSFCQKMYACYQGSDLMTGFGLPATEPECETQENVNCNASPPEPAYCKGNAQTSTANATACAAEFNGLTCTELMQPTGSGACKTELCAM